MPTLSGFLRPVTTVESKQIVVSSRFKGEDGKILPFTIKTITQEENNRLIRASIRKNKVGSTVQENLDHQQYQSRLIVACVSEPDFASKEMCDAYKTVDPLDVPNKMLWAGEFVKLSDVIMKLNGFKDSEDLNDEAKNS